jgi:hypothetical protein
MVKNFRFFLLFGAAVNSIDKVAIFLW